MLNYYNRVEHSLIARNYIIKGSGSEGAQSQLHELYHQVCHSKFLIIPKHTIYTTRIKRYFCIICRI